MDDVLNDVVFIIVFEKTNWYESMITNFWFCSCWNQYWMHFIWKSIIFFHESIVYLHERNGNDEWLSSINVTVTSTTFNIWSTTFNNINNVHTSFRSQNDAMANKWIKMQQIVGTKFTFGHPLTFFPFCSIFRWRINFLVWYQFWIHKNHTATCNKFSNATCQD